MFSPTSMVSGKNVQYCFWLNWEHILKTLVQIVKMFIFKLLVQNVKMFNIDSSICGGASDFCLPPILAKNKILFPLSNNVNTWIFIFSFKSLAQHLYKTLYSTHMYSLLTHMYSLWHTHVQWYTFSESIDTSF